jgi:hypothetical protein
MIQMHNGKAYMGDRSKIELEKLVDDLAERAARQWPTSAAPEVSALLKVLHDLITITVERHGITGAAFMVDSARMCIEPHSLPPHFGSEG